MSEYLDLYNHQINIDLETDSALSEQFKAIYEQIVNSRKQYHRRMAQNGIYGKHARSAGRSFCVPPGQRGSCKIDRTQVWIDEADMIDPEGFIWEFSRDGRTRQHVEPFVSVGKHLIPETTLGANFRCVIPKEFQPKKFYFGMGELIEDINEEIKDCFGLESVGTIGKVSFKQSTLTTSVKAAMKKV